jgi:hypothetical protein
MRAPNKYTTVQLPLIGIGSIYLFTRTTCQNHPVDGCVQMT